MTPDLRRHAAALLALTAAFLAVAAGCAYCLDRLDLALVGGLGGAVVGGIGVLMSPLEDAS